MPENIYTKNGCRTRQEYLDSLAEEYGVAKVVVYSLAHMLGPSEDFDGLINALEDETL